MFVGVVLYIVIHTATYYLFVHVLGKNHYKNMDNKEVNKSPFFRNDLKNWGLIKNFPMVITFWPRMIGALINLLLYTIWVVIIMIGA